MSSAPTFLASPSRRHHLPPMKPMKSSRCGVNSLVRNGSPLPTATKRSLAIASDENADPSPRFVASPHKRVKSALSNSLNAALKSVAPKSTAAAAPKPRRAFGTLVDVTNTRANPVRSSISISSSSGNGADKSSSSKKSSRTTILKPVKKTSPTKKPASPPRRAGARVRAPSPRSCGMKRSYSPPAFRRVDPPLSLQTASITSIDSLLAAVSRPRSTLSTSITLDDSKDITPPSLVAANIPASWSFDIYEDTPEETLQNLMEHSTHTLDISDSSDSEDTATLPNELHERGKENIPPVRLAELLTTSPIDLANSMRIDVAPSPVNARHHTARHRPALREMRGEELELEKDSILLPTLAGECFLEFLKPSTSKKRVFEEEKHEEQEAPKSPGSPGFVVWDEDEDEVAIAAAVPLPLEFEIGLGVEE